MFMCDVCVLHVHVAVWPVTSRTHTLTVTRFSASSSYLMASTGVLLLRLLVHGASELGQDFFQSSRLTTPDFTCQSTSPPEAHERRAYRTGYRSIQRAAATR
jgi:hypothetical protein